MPITFPVPFQNTATLQLWDRLAQSGQEAVSAFVDQLPADERVPVTLKNGAPGAWPLVAFLMASDNPVLRQEGWKQARGREWDQEDRLELMGISLLVRDLAAWEFWTHTPSLPKEWRSPLGSKPSPSLTQWFNRFRGVWMERLKTRFPGNEDAEVAVAVRLLADGADPLSLLGVLVESGQHAAVRAILPRASSLQNTPASASHPVAQAWIRGQFELALELRDAMYPRDSPEHAGFHTLFLKDAQKVLIDRIIYHEENAQVSELPEKERAAVWDLIKGYGERKNDQPFSTNRQDAVDHRRAELAEISADFLGGRWDHVPLDRTGAWESAALLVYPNLSGSLDRLLALIQCEPLMWRSEYVTDRLRFAVENRMLYDTQLPERWANLWALMKQGCVTLDEIMVCLNRTSASEEMRATVAEWGLAVSAPPAREASRRPRL